MRPPSMRPPPPPSRTQTATPTAQLNALRSPTGSVAPSVAASPARSVAAGAKRKEREYEHAEETNINVVVRCRGRNDREVRENSGVVVSTEGNRSKKVELSMGPSALSNKTYQFDRVFSPAADQAMIFEDVVEPILGEVKKATSCPAGRCQALCADGEDRFCPASTAPYLPMARRAPERLIL